MTIPVTYTMNGQVSNDYIILIYGKMPCPDDVRDDDPGYKEIMDSVLKSILMRLPLGPLAVQYRVVCNIEARPDFGGQIEMDKDGNKVALEGRYRVWIALHMQKGYTDERSFLCTTLAGGLKGEIISESCEKQDVFANKLALASITNCINPHCHPSMQQLVRYFRSVGIHGDLCLRIFGYMEMEGVECVSVNGVSEKLMVDVWSEIIGKSTQYMNDGGGYMVHPMWMCFAEHPIEGYVTYHSWNDVREQSCTFDGDHWRVYNILHAQNDRSGY